MIYAYIINKNININEPNRKIAYNYYYFYYYWNAQLKCQYKQFQISGKVIFI